MASMVAINPSKTWQRSNILEQKATKQNSIHEEIKQIKFAKWLLTVQFRTLLSPCIPNHRCPQIFWKPGIRSQITDTRRVTRSEFHTEHLQILGDTVKKNSHPGDLAPRVFFIPFSEYLKQYYILHLMWKATPLITERIHTTINIMVFWNVTVSFRRKLLPPSSE